MKNKENFNEWYLFNDGFFSYYINNATGEKKFELVMWKLKQIQMTFAVLSKWNHCRVFFEKIN